MVLAFDRLLSNLVALNLEFLDRLTMSLGGDMQYLDGFVLVQDLCRELVHSRNRR